MKATAQTIGDGSHTSKGILQVGDGLNVDNGVVSLETAQGLTVDQSQGHSSVRVKLPSGKGGLMFTENNELDVRMVEHPSGYSSVPLAHTIDGAGVMFDSTKGLTAHDNQLALAPATVATLGGVSYDDKTIQTGDGSQLFAAIGCVSNVRVLGTSYSNIAPKPICVDSDDYVNQFGVWFGFYVTEPAISFNEISLEFRMVNGKPFRSGGITRLASFLEGKGIMVEDHNSVYISSSIVSGARIDLTLQSSLTVATGPHWFEVEY